MQVLVVDDDVVSRMVLMHLVDACGPFDIIEAEDGADAWAQLAAGLRPVICFCDLRMPRLSGMELLARVRAETDPALASMPFVLVTSATDRGTVDQATGLGADGYLVKPFQGDQVAIYLAPFTDAGEGAAGGDTETVPATLRRLGIGAERLLIYLGGFHTQLASAATDLAALLARGDHAGAHLRLERLQAGCLTLGLNEAGAALRFASGALDPAAVELALAGTVRAVMQQTEAVQQTIACPSDQNHRTIRLIPI